MAGRPAAPGPCDRSDRTSLEAAGLLLGLISAGAFGSSDALAAVVSRRLGATVTAAGSLLASLVSLVALALIVRPAAPSNLDWLPLVLGLGLLAGIGYLCLVQGLRHGPVAVVSPIGASVGAAVVVLAVLLLGDRPDPLQWIAVAVTVVGSVLAAINPGSGSGRLRVAGRGPAFALAAVACYSISIVGLQGPLREIGLVWTILAWRCGNVAVAWSVLAWAVRRTSGPRGVEPGTVPMSRERGLASLSLVGILESAGQAFRALGLQLAPAWLVGLAASVAPIVVITTGVVLFGERLRPTQWLGIALVGIGVVLITLS